jgi:hypothetical protein
VALGQGIPKDYGVRNDDLPSFFCRHDRCAGLYIGDVPLNSRNADEVTQSERFLQQQENAGKEVLKNILKCKTFLKGSPGLGAITHDANAWCFPEDSEVKVLSDPRRV